MALLNQQTTPPVVTKPQPIGQRVSAGLYRDAKGGLVKSKTGMIPTAKPKPVVPPPATTMPAPTPSPTLPAPQQPQAVNPEVTKTLFPTIGPGSDLYKFQLQEGQQALGKSLAAKGQTKSGAAITEELNLPLRLAAANSATSLNQQNNNADRLGTMQQNESTRLTNQDNEQWNRRFSLAELMGRQDPFQQAFAGFNTSAGLQGDAGQSMANYLKDAYKRVSAGGGRGGAPAIQPAFNATGPDYSNIMPQQIMADTRSNAGWGDIATNLISSLFRSK